jgi:hypothetical protein
MLPVTKARKGKGKGKRDNDFEPNFTLKIYVIHIELAIQIRSSR